MLVYQLLAKLRLLTLIGHENGELIWCGPNRKWDELSVEEESILRDWEIYKLVKTI
jgi:hypothetical protein